MTPRGALRETLSRLYHRITGQEAAALRAQRQAADEEADVLRRALAQAIRGERAADERRMGVETELRAADALWRAHAEDAGRARRWGAEVERERDELRQRLATCRLHGSQLQDAHLECQLNLRAAVAHVQRLVTARDEHALADAATWLRARGEPEATATEQEGSRGGLAWMPGERGDEETLPSAGEER